MGYYLVYSAIKLQHCITAEASADDSYIGEKNVFSTLLHSPSFLQAPSNQPSRAIVNQSNMADKEKMENDSFLKSICKYPLGHE